ncbi:hypothetical protein pqer_cds_647 [Pandoravirus quercus]|uniref:Uncharacterized protein n=1 Tax=Pandoravirus quercus TaxID=2107709 RepID=A0A2U7U9G2_9VIRU|nr:hypothetical protein pqer_cds_647 [Pandoravirus quercus]AVK75069.1 hypothetical protein pqer_cds_647 [Pandoravirus quercus]
MQRTRSLALPMTRRASMRAFSTTSPAMASHRPTRCRPLATGLHHGLLRRSPAPAPASRLVKAAPPIPPRSDAMLSASVVISTCAATAWASWYYNKYIPRHRSNAFVGAGEAIVFGVATGSLVALAGTVLMPTALALGPCLGVALLCAPITGIMQVALGVMQLKNAAPGGNRRQWFTQAVLM